MLEQVLDVLKKARSYVERGWISRAMARDSAGELVHPCDPYATCWCLSGAIRAAQGQKLIPQVEIEITKLLREVGGFNKPVYQWNDDPDRTKYEVLELLDRALAS